VQLEPFRQQRGHCTTGFFIGGFAPNDDRVTGGNTHAWAQIYVPGPGWIDFDPSSGVVGNENLVRVAVVHEPREAIPLQGTWFGTASDHLAMKVVVRVTEAELDDDVSPQRLRRR
jgi:transglutaminase-like putative cysteine protease